MPFDRLGDPASDEINPEPGCMPLDVRQTDNARGLVVVACEAIFLEVARLVNPIGFSRILNRIGIRQST